MSAKPIPASYFQIGEVGLRVQEFNESGTGKLLLIRAETRNTSIGLDLTPLQALDFADALIKHAKSLQAVAVAGAA